MLRERVWLATLTRIKQDYHHETCNQCPSGATEIRYHQLCYICHVYPPFSKIQLHAAHNSVATSSIWTDLSWTRRLWLANCNTTNSSKKPNQPTRMSPYTWAQPDSHIIHNKTLWKLGKPNPHGLLSVVAVCGKREQEHKPVSDTRPYASFC